MLAVRRFAGDYLVDELVTGRRGQAGSAGGLETSSRRCWPTAPGCGSSSAWSRSLGVWFVGDTARAARARRAAAPALENRATTYGIAAVALLALVLVAPQIARGWLSALILIGLVVAGIEVVRTIVQREADQPV